MMAINKKRISSELLHIALVITLLRGNDNRFYRQSPVISTNFFNDVSVSNDIMGPSWAYSRTSFHHHFYHDPPIHEIKAIETNYSMNEDFNSEYYGDEDIDIDLMIINQLRSLTISRFNSLPRLGKDQPTFQDITAYLLSESTSPTNAASPPATDVVEFDSPVTPQQNEVEMEMTELSEETLILSPGVDSGHEETGDDADVHSTTSESLKEFPLEMPNALSRNSERRESYGFHSDSEEEMIAHEILFQQTEGDNYEQINEDVKIKTEQVEEGEGDADIEPSIEVEAEGITPEVKDEKLETEKETDWETWVEDLSEDGELRLSPLLDSNPNLDQNTLDLLEHVHLNEVGGAAGIDHGLSPDHQEWGVDSGLDFLDFPDLLLEAERSSLEFYKKFNDITENELNNAIAPQDLHEFDDEETNKPDTSSTVSSGLGDAPGLDGLEEETVVKQETDPMPSSSGNSELPNRNEEEEPFSPQEVISAMLDDFLEGDSGVFDFLGGSPASIDVDQDDASNNSHDSSLTTAPRPLSQSNEDFDIEADESSFSADMIQTAPIHASARPTSHAAQPRGFQVHSRMPGLLRGGSMEQRWQDLANLLSLQSSSHDPSGAGIHQPIPHHFAPHPYHHHHHHHHPPTPLHHSMHPTHFGSAVPPTTPYSTDTARSVLLQNATLPPPELNATGPYVNVGMGASSNLGSAVASSMHLTNSSEPMIDPSSHYKMMDPSHDMLYYQNSTTEMANQTSTDGFNLSSILNDDELQLMDMAMNEGMYSMRSMDNGVTSTNLTTVGAHHAPQGPAANVSHNGAPTCSVLGATGGTSTEDRMEASSDSAVSSMGSERVPPMTDPPMSDNEWVDADSHPHGPHDLSPYSMDYSRGKLGGYEYYKDGSRVPGGPVAQKKHHMFGKRFQQEQSSHPYPLPSHLSYPPPHGSSSQGPSLDLDKYGCSTDFGRYNGQRQGTSGPLDPSATNHTYALPPTHPDNPLMKAIKPPQQKEKQQKNDSLTRDEKKARAMNIPITTEDVINLPMDEFNERLSKYDLSESQLSLIRDIRRRGKNKVAAQNCRKRKLDQIIQLADEVQRIREKKQSLMREQESLMGRRGDLKERYSMLYRTVFQALRDNEGHPYSPFEYNLHHAADGSVVLLPRNTTQPSTSTNSNENGMSHSSNGPRRDKSKDDAKKE